MNTHKGKAKLKNFLILLDSGFSSTIVIIKLIKKLKPKEDTVIRLHKQAVNITTNIRLNIEITLPEFSATRIVTWSFMRMTPLRAGMI